MKGAEIGNVVKGVEVGAVGGICEFRDGFEPKFIKGLDLESVDIIP